MKKLISLSLACFMISMVAYGQESAVGSNETTVKKSSCVPTKECAEKMGMTLEECKLFVEKACGNARSIKDSETEGSSVLQTSMAVKDVESSKAACCNVKECAALLGITVEECLARCKLCCPGKSKKP